MYVVDQLTANIGVECVMIPITLLLQSEAFRIHTQQININHVHVRKAPNLHFRNVWLKEPTSNENLLTAETGVAFDACKLLLILFYSNLLLLTNLDVVQSKQFHVSVSLSIQCVQWYEYIMYTICMVQMLVYHLQFYLSNASNRQLRCC